MKKLKNINCPKLNREELKKINGGSFPLDPRTCICYCINPTPLGIEFEIVECDLGNVCSNGTPPIKRC